MKHRHILLTYLVVLCLLTFLDRLCIAVAGPRMQAELGIPTERWGWVLGAFVLSYGLFGIPAGVFGDRSGQRKVLTGIVLWWSAFTALTGAMSNVTALIAIRFLFGMGEAGAYPCMSGVIARWFPQKERAAAQGYIWGASRAGGALAPLLVVPIQQNLGWRASFWIFGACGIIWCIAWWWWYRDHTAESPAPPPAAAHSLDWRVLAGNRQMWIIIMMYGSYAWVSWFYFSWLHTFLVKARGFTESEMAFASALPFLLGTAANVAGGYLSDFAVKKLGARRGRTMVGSSCLVLSACFLIATGLTTGKIAALVLLALGFGVSDLMLPSAWAICLDIGGKHSGAVTGAMNTAGQLGGFLCTVIFGYVVTYFHSYNAPLLLIAGMLLFSATMFSRIDATRQLFPEK